MSVECPDCGGGRRIHSLAAVASRFPGGFPYMKRCLMLLGLLCALGASAPAAHATFNGVLYISNFDNHTIDSIKVVNGIFQPASQGVINTLPGSDGIICNEKTLELIV